MKKIAFKTFGCRVNLYETDALASLFKQKGYIIEEDPSHADAIVVNSCTVTNQSDQKCRQFLHQTKRLNPDIVIALTGCMVNNKKEELLRSHIADFVIDNERKTAIFHILDAYFQGTIIDPEGYDKDLFSYEAAYNTFHTRSLIKIHDGCDNYCSYCIIPMTRGRATSRNNADIYRNIRDVIDHGFKEIVLTGVNMGRYNYQGTNFENLVENILEIPGDFRLRISSIEPEQFSDHFLDLINHPKLAPHMHICLQSGSDNILKRMHRHYTVSDFRTMCERIRAAKATFNITTDIIVGFPGETEEDFQETVNLARELRFSHIHTFKFSIRNGTLAQKMTDQIPEKTKSIRSSIIRKISAENKAAYYEMMQGQQQRMLIERIGTDGIARGYGEHYIPIRIIGSTDAKNTFREVTLGDIINKDKDEKAEFIAL